MIEINIASLIRALGAPRRELIDRGTIPESDTEEVFPGSETFFSLLDEGVELSFCADTTHFKMLTVYIVDGPISGPVYQGELPEPLSTLTDKSSVDAAFPDPIKSRGPLSFPKPIGETGGWATYSLDTLGFVDTQVTFHFNPSLQIEYIGFFKREL